MSIAWVRKRYNVPAKHGARIIYEGSGRSEYGIITSARGGHLNIRLDGLKHSLPFHPTWKLRYL